MTDNLKNYPLYLFKTIRLFIIKIALLVIPCNRPLNAVDPEWQEVKPTIEGEQWWSIPSFKKHNNNKTEVVTRFKKANYDNRTFAQEFLYNMNINCYQQHYRDDVINGKLRSDSKWKSPKDDKLISEVIESVCSFKLS